MLEIALLFKKEEEKNNWKNRQSVEGSVPNPLLASGGWELYFCDFFQLLKNYNLISLILEWRSVGPLAKLAPLAQTSSYGTAHQGPHSPFVRNLDCRHKSNTDNVQGQFDNIAARALSKDLRQFYRGRELKRK